MFIKRSIKGVGISVPTRQMKKAGSICRSRSFAASIPPRSSIMGIRDSTNTVSSAGMVWLKSCTRASTICSIF